ncbi:MAG TPA: sulfatase-like hydrolase/transferase [Thermoanaerobaculia bacterium]|nr:sulfatase-like hydrolase/transferase [Thermoanaerobaculia bacterium]
MSRRRQQVQNRPLASRPSRRRVAVIVAVAAVVIVIAAAGLFAWRARRGRGLGELPDGLDPARLNLVVVTLDTTRADRLGCYGARGVETPNLDRLAARGVLFENAISPTPLTLPAHCSLFTGLLPGAHGVRDNGGFKLAPERVTLAEVLKAHGWATGGFIAAYVLDHRWGIAQGFDRYFDDFDLSKWKTVSMGDIQRRGDEVVAKALDWMGGDGVRERPFFAWVHLYDPHSPYDPPEPFASRYRGHPYNGEIAWTDSLVGRLLAGLDRLGVSSRTVIAVIGDHGESLGEHGESGHGFFLYEPTTHVPFLLAGPYPGLAGRRVRAVTRHVDLLPTLLELLGVKEGPRGQGRSLVPLIVAQKGAGGGADREDGSGLYDGFSEAYYSRFHYGWSELRAVRTERWHFIEAPRPELYDLAADPGELHNLAADERRVTARLRGALAAIERATGPAPAAKAPIEEDEETLRKLSALGYVGTHARTEGKSWRDLPDPKDRIRVYNLMDRARQESLKGEADASIATLREILALDPEVIDAWFMLGNSYYQKRDWAQAAALFRKTLDKRPDHDFAMIGLADTLVATGRVDDAVLGYRRFLARDPDNAQITYRLAQVLLDAGRDGEAEAAFRKTLSVEPRTARAEVGLGVVAFRRHDPEGARRAIARAVAIDPQAPYANYNLALLRESQGALAGALAAYRAEVAAHPGAYKAWFNLGRLLGRTGDRAGGVEALRKAIAENKSFALGHLFLAQALLETGDLEGAKAEAREGLALGAESPYAPLGHYVLADALSRQGRRAEAAEEARRGRAIERH